MLTSCIHIWKIGQKFMWMQTLYGKVNSYNSQIWKHIQPDWIGFFCFAKWLPKYHNFVSVLTTNDNLRLLKAIDHLHSTHIHPFSFTWEWTHVCCKVAGNKSRTVVEKDAVYGVWNTHFSRVKRLVFIGLKQVAGLQKWEVQMVKWQGGVMTNFSIN